MANNLVQRLRDTFDDTPGWALSARSYSMMKRPADTAVAYVKVVALTPEAASLRADYADAPATAQGGILAGASTEQMRPALKADPDGPKVLVLAALVTIERGDVSDVIAHWERPYQSPPSESAGAKQIATNLAATRTGQQEASCVK